jgi:hypothetical protein
MVTAMANAQPAPTSADPGSEAPSAFESMAVEAPPSELNQWKRGFTPQAEIWNGRMAMLGLSVGLGVLLIGRIAGKA